MFIFRLFLNFVNFVKFTSNCERQLQNKIATDISDLLFLRTGGGFFIYCSSSI
jgi:hypothetical protein